MIGSTPFYTKIGTVWYDWVWINWEYENGSMVSVPAQVSSIIDLRSIDTKETQLKAGLYICIKSISVIPKPKWKNSKIVHCGSFQKDKFGREIFRMVHIENVVRKCYAVPDLDDFEYSSGKTSNWLFVRSKEEWADLF